MDRTRITNNAGWAKDHLETLECLIGAASAEDLSGWAPFFEDLANKCHDLAEQVNQTEKKAA